MENIEQGPKGTVMVEDHETCRVQLTSGEALVKSCISVYREKDNPGPGCAQKQPFVWMTSGSHATLQVSRVSSRTSPGPFLAVPWCCRQCMLTVASVSPGVGGLSNEKHPLIPTPWNQLKPFLLFSSFLSRLKQHMFKDTGVISGAGVLW